MASRGIALVNRLRLKEAPAAADCTLAARLVALDGTAADFIELLDDLEATSGDDPAPRKMRVRLALLAETVPGVEGALSDTIVALSRYFALRADVDSEDESGGDGDSADEEDGPESEEAGAPTAVATEAADGPLGAALHDMGVPVRVVESLVTGLTSLADDLRRMRAALADLLGAAPDIDLALDTLSAVEVDAQHALDEALRPAFIEGEVPYRPGLATLAAEALVSR